MAKISAKLQTRLHFAIIPVGMSLKKRQIPELRLPAFFRLADTGLTSGGSTPASSGTVTSSPLSLKTGKLFTVLKFAKTIRELEFSLKS